MVARAFLALLMAASGLVVVGEPPGRDRAGVPRWVADLAGTQQTPAATPWRESSVAAAAASVPGKPVSSAFPAAQRWETGPGVAAAARRPVEVSGAAGQKAVTLEVLDRAAAQRAGVSGFLFRTSKVDDPAKLTVDYSSFAGAYGGDYAGRLRLVAMPECVLRGCAEQGKRLPVNNDLVARKLTADVAGLDGASVYAVTSGVSGEQGTYGATPLSIAGAWQVTPGAGAFAYSYPIDVPKPGAGSAPTVAMSYSSAVVDGLTLGTNTQASPTGLGWSDFANAFIERRYDSCYRVHLSDLCWASDNAVLSLGGVSGTLLPTNSPANTEWKLQSDPGWRIERNGDALYTTIYGRQSWKVTGPDGTVYIFGGGHMPGRQTNSILSVPVVADDPLEPCRGAGDTIGACEQGWRWYLDRVIDPDGNVTAYLYERQTNIYSAILGIGANERYHSGALLTEIIYGGRDWDERTYSARVLFDLEHRCVFLVPICPAAEPGNTGGFPDVPVDLICTSTTKGTCSVHSPSFFLTKRYAGVRTEVKVGTQWKPVAQYTLQHTMDSGGTGASQKMRVLSIQLKGKAFGRDTNYPPTRFGYSVHDNRSDHDSYIPKAMRHYRINQVFNPFGGVTTVVYGNNRWCSPSYRPPTDPIPRWDQNVRDCFPQEVKDNEFTATGVFNKYLVMIVAEGDGYSPEVMRTTYTYEGDPAWGFDLSAFELDQTKIGWSVWRGYGAVSIRKGTALTRQILFRGWHNDFAIQKTGTGWVLTDRPASVQSSDGATFADDLALAGRVLEEQRIGTLAGVAGQVLEKRIHRFTKRVVTPMPGYRFNVEWVGLASTTEWVATGPNLWKQRRSQTTYNTNRQPATTLEEGWLDVTGDERCSITTYADNATRHMFVYPASNKKVAGTCTSTTVLAHTQTLYDNSTTLGVVVDRGNPTVQRVQLDASTWSQTATEFDAFGRLVRTTSPTGAIETVAYRVTAAAPANQIPIQTVVTNALGHEQITDYHAEFGVPSRKQDANGNVTSIAVDEFGRTTAVWLPTDTNLAGPSWQFSYDIPNKSVRSRRLVACCDPLSYEDTWVVYDGFWRERQVQGASPVSGKVLVSETTYDNHGLVLDEMVEQALPGTPGRLIDGGTSWLNRTRHTYDEIGRQVRREWWRGNNPAHATTTAYAAGAVTVTGPDGRRAAERVDGLGRTVAVEESDGAGWAVSNYQYDLADRLLSATDPAGNKIEYAYNLAGWRIGQTDPNRGSALFAYDLAGRQTAVGTSMGVVLAVYDAIGRQTERRADSLTGPLLAKWQFDTAPLGKGLLHKETNSSGWVSEILGYDGKGRVAGTKLVVPAGIAGLSGEYTVRQGYDPADRVRSTQLPAIGGLPAETVTTGYNSIGLLTRLGGLEEYVSGVTYDDRGRRTAASFGPKPGGAVWMAKAWGFDNDQRISQSQTLVAGGVVSDHRLVFDNSGMLKEKLVTQATLSWRECFGYDTRARLTSAHTVAPATGCANGTPGTGDRPYRSTFQYSNDNRLLSRSENGTATAYTYPASGAARPHAPARVGGDTYTWDVEGKLATRTVAGQSETFAWDKQDRLTSVTGSQGATSFIYDASGNRLLRRTPDGRATLYYAGHEITVNASGAAVKSVRPYTFDGAIVATRTLQGVEYLVSDAMGSVEMAYRSGQTTPVTTRAYLPYGKVRAETGDAATDRGFIGQVEDTSTRLSYLNDRYYDAGTGVFISPDALLDTAKPKTLNPYTYASGNPANQADPTGTYAASTFGLELENSRLRGINRELIAHIGELNNHLSELQDVIRQQADAINKMLTYIAALEAEITRQASIIRQLQARVAHLQRVVVAQQREIGRLRGIVAYQAGVIRRQAWVIGYYKGVVDQLGMRLWGGTPLFEPVMRSIHSFRGIPAGAFDGDHISIAQAQVSYWVGEWSTEFSENSANIRRISDLEFNIGLYEDVTAGAVEQINSQSARIRELEFAVEYGYLDDNGDYFCAMANGGIPFDHDPAAATLGFFNSILPTGVISGAGCQILNNGG